MHSPVAVKTCSKTGGVGIWSTPAPDINDLSEKDGHMFTLNEVANSSYPGDGNRNRTILVYKAWSKEECNKEVKSLTFVEE